MQTYSHFIITAMVNRNVQGHQANPQARGKPARLPPLHSGAFLWGSVLPDVPLILIALGAITIDLVNGARWEPGSEGGTSAVGYLFREMFFNDPWVQTAHNLFHAPLLVMAYVGLGYWLWRRGEAQGKPWGSNNGGRLFWLGLACALHTAIDIPVHYDDGPLLLFPFNWTVRFYSPISYWDNSRFGAQFAILEHMLVLLALIWLGLDWWRRRQANRAHSDKGK